MARQYKREYTLEISPFPEDTVIINDLRVRFEVSKSILSYPNLCKLDLFNPNDRTVAALSDRFTVIAIFAGYEGNSGLIFTGQIRNTFHSREGVDRIVSVYAGDGEQDWQNTFFNRTYSDAVRMSVVINDVLQSFPSISGGATLDIPEDKDVKIRGLTESGAAKDILNRLTAEVGIEWSIQDGQVVALATDAPLKGQEAVVISPETGMVGSPTITEIGVNVTTLLNPVLLPNRAFTIVTRNADVQVGNLFFRELRRNDAAGTYKIQEVVFTGDSRGGDWTANVTGKAIDGQQL